MRRRFVLRKVMGGTLLVVLLAVSVCAEDRAAESPIFAPHAKLASRTAKELAGLFGQARKKGFGAVADEIGVQLLHFDEDHGGARAWLGYERVNDGWSRPERLTTHKSTSTKGEAGFRKRWVRKTETLGRSFWRLLDKAAEELETEARHFVHEDLAVLVPDNERLVRERTHEIVDGQWLTLEARKARETWAAWQKEKLAFTERPEPEDIALYPRLEQVQTLKFKSRVRVGGVRVWGTCSREEAVLIAKRSIGAANLFATVFGLDFRLPEDLGFIVVETDLERRILAAELRFKGMRLRQPAYGLPDTNVFVIARRQGWPVRLDTALRFLLHRLYEQEFGCGPRREWAAQGVSVLLTYMTVSTFYTVMGWNNSNATPLDDTLEMVLFEREADWGGFGRDLINRDALPTIAQLEPQSRGQIWVTDLLGCYIHAYYFIVVHDNKSANLFQRIGKGEKAAAAIQAEFGWSMDEYHARVARWLNDYRKFVKGRSRRVPVRGKQPR